ncbi:MAG TPA: hypothetical protein VEG38_20255 [Acidimicrobiia bacterium]|nr:hypothetical protein [Acidimicrobiia bacterium]
MIDRYARDALACYGRLRRLGEAEARAELEHFDRLLGISGQPGTIRALSRRTPADHTADAVPIPGNAKKAAAGRAMR